ncbi:DUF364 domain-containing protein [candidate division WOR-3 bacterium]|nr:DUF364 domain-containing protein [candidate division WOR-3 bacterium]
MGIIEELIEKVQPYPVKDVICGVFDTLVFSKNCGIASTLKGNPPHRRVRGSGRLNELTLTELARYALSDNPLDTSVGMAAINSTLPGDAKNLKNINAKVLIKEKGKDRVVGVIGHFPFLDDLRKEFKELYIFEKIPQSGDLKEKDIPEYLPYVDVAVITGTSIPNHTFEEILGYTKEDSYKIVLGPTTPLSPILFDYGIDAISGVIVRDIPSIIKQVKEATPFRNLKGVEYITLLREDYNG